ncbi:hypothetical protein PAN31117_05380 [Pandoraea anapnoica]|uniref:DUF4376 domain-containing protein n=1 Tax=Pandoraea anapnoica TaxID=2508301 RepID=A0A5E5ATN4_9BURK|nr:hypothetical protein PAN31117_05380 [Pandoraea anapnoica]
MKTFAQILFGRLHWKFEAEERPEFAPGFVVTEISGFDPMPQEGWVATQGGDSWTFAPEQPPEVPLDDARAFARLNMRAACRRELLGGFVSSPTSEERTYGSDEADQLNLLHAVMLAAPAKLWCQVGDRWDFVDHDAQQLAAVAADWAVKRQAIQQHYADRLREIDAAERAEDVRAIAW